MDRLSCLTAFVETARLGGMAAAARKLNVPRAKISRQIQTLEAELGAQLLVRTTRALQLTEAGSILLESASEALDKLHEAEQRVRDGQTEIRGTVRINAPMSFGVRVLAPLLPIFQRDHPLLELQVVLSDEFVDPVRGGFDVTLRIAHIADSGLIARHLCDVPRLMVASPGYLARRGTPTHPEQLAAHAWLGYGYLATGARTLLTHGDETFRVAANGPMCANNGEVLMQAAIGGLGIVLLPRFIVEEALAGRALQEVLPDWRAPATAVYAMFPPNRRMPLRTRRLIDYLVEALTAPGR